MPRTCVSETRELGIRQGYSVESSLRGEASRPAAPVRLRLQDRQAAAINPSKKGSDPFLDLEVPGFADFYLGGGVVVDVGPVGGVYDVLLDVLHGVEADNDADVPAGFGGFVGWYATVTPRTCGSALRSVRVRSANSARAASLQYSSFNLNNTIRSIIALPDSC